MSKLKFPLQPIKEHRFVENKIVQYLLKHGGLDLNDLGVIDFPKADKQQFAQLIGYSVSGYSTLSYVDETAYNVAMEKADNNEVNEKDSQIESLTNQLNEAKEGVRKAATALFEIHPDDLSS